MRLHLENDWLPKAEALAIGREFPTEGWHRFGTPHEEGKLAANVEAAGPLTAALHDRLASIEFVDWLARVMSEPNLVADPDLIGAGIHSCAPFGHLDMHVDFDLHPKRPQLIRSVNVIVFVSEEGWLDSSWGGYLELREFDEYGTTRQHLEVAPEPGLLIAWSAEQLVWHGHPVPLDPQQPARRSVPAYYYRQLHEHEHVAGRDTTWMTDSYDPMMFTLMPDNVR